MQHLKVKIITSVKWSFLTEIVSKTLQPLTFLILATILTPKDFGLLAIAQIFVGLAQIIQDFGLSKTIIQRQRDIEKIKHIVFWFGLISSVIIYFIIFFISPFIATIYGNYEITSVIRVVSIQIIFYGLTIVPQAFMQKEFNFNQLFFIRFLSGFFQLTVSVLMAFKGYGVWSPVIGILVGSASQVILFWLIKPWFPKFILDYKLTKEIYSFSIWVFLEAFLSWIILWGDSLILGYVLSVEELGVYRVGVTFVILVFGLIFNPVIPVAYSYFSKIQGDKELLAKSLIKVTKIIAFISLPIGLSLASFSELISHLFFKERFEGIEYVIAIIGIKDAIAWLVGINPEAYRAIGRPDVNTKLLIVAIIYYIPTYLIAAPFGLIVFTIARLGVALLGLLLHVFLANKLSGLPFRYIIECSKYPVIASIVPAVFVYFTVNKLGSMSDFTLLFLSINLLSVAFIFYTILIYVLDKSLITDLKSLFLNK